MTTKVKTKKKKGLKALVIIAVIIIGLAVFLNVAVSYSRLRAHETLRNLV